MLGEPVQNLVAQQQVDSFGFRISVSGAVLRPPVCGPTFAILKQTSEISKLSNVSNASKAANQTLVLNKARKAIFWQTSVCKPKSQTHRTEMVKY